MLEAWIIRGMEREKIIKEVMGLIYEKAGDDNNIFFEIVEIATRHLRKKSGYTGRISTTELFFNKILPLVQRFSRASEEERFIVAEISKKALNSGLMDCYSFLAKLEIDNPERVFCASSAMSEIL